MARSYQEVTAGLLQGPRRKTAATYDLETICKAFISDAQVHCRHNALKELEVTVNGKYYNLTLILQNHADFEQLDLTDAEVARYAQFVKNEATLQPHTLNHEEYLAKIPALHHLRNLEHGEMLAIALYTGHHYELFNDFLRHHGTSKKFTSIQQTTLTLQVKESLLMAAVATRGLRKSRESELVDHLHYDDFTDIVRIETPKTTVNQQRKKDINKNKTTLQAGFTSSKLPAGIFNKLGSNKTHITYEQPDSVNPIGKNISKISLLSDENEVLFPPGTEFQYYYHEEISGNDLFYGVPVRTISLEKSYRYSKNTIETRKEVINFFEELRKCDDPHIGRETALYLEATPLSYIEKIILQNKILGCLSEQERVDWLITTNNYLIPHAQYVYHHHLSKPFSETGAYSTDSILQVHLGEKIEDGDVTITPATLHRPNHGLPHSFRSALYAKPVTGYYSRHAIDLNFRQFCQNRNAKAMEPIEIALLFSSSGRENDCGFFDNNNLYQKYRRASADNFAAYAKLINMPQSEIDKFYELILYMGNPEYINGKIPGKENIPADYQYCFHIMNMCHKLDLMRCYSLSQYIAAMAKIAHLVEPSEDQEKSLNHRYELTSRMIRATGDRLFTEYKDGVGLVSTDAAYLHDDFYHASTNPQACLTLAIRGFVEYQTLRSRHAPESAPKNELTNTSPDIAHFDFKLDFNLINNMEHKSIRDKLLNIVEQIKVEKFNLYSSTESIQDEFFKGYKEQMLKSPRDDQFNLMKNKIIPSYFTSKKTDHLAFSSKFYSSFTEIKPEIKLNTTYTLFKTRF